MKTSKKSPELNFGIFIPEIFEKSTGFMRNSRDLYPRDSGFFRNFFSWDGISRQKATSDYNHEILVEAWGFWNFKNFGKYTCGGKDQRWDDYLFQSRNLQQSALQHRNRYLVFRFCLMNIHRIYIFIRSDHV